LYFSGCRFSLPTFRSQHYGVAIRQLAIFGLQLTFRLTLLNTI
jgi:hypothetical protein